MNLEKYWDNPTSTESLLDQAKGFAREYLSSLNKRSVFPNEEAIGRLDSFNEPLPENSSESQLVLDALHQFGSPATVAQTSGRYFGFVNGGMLPIGLAARWLSDTWDQNTAHYVMSPINSRLEETCERWLAELLHLPADTAAGFVTGTSLANFCGMCAGRNEVLGRLGWDVVRKGLAGAPKLRVIAGEGAHAAVQKAASLLGLGTDNIEIVPMDEQGRFRVDLLPSLSEPALIIAQAGSVNTGAIDPIDDICDAAASSGSWVHVDGAFGLWARAVPRFAEACRGFEKADSWAADAHKTLNVPYDSGIILCKNRKALISAFEASASYFQWSQHRDPMKYTPSMSKRARAVELWAVLKFLGRQGVIDLIEQLCDHAKTISQILEQKGFGIENDVVFNQVLVSCGEDAVTEKTLSLIQQSGECWCGGSKWNGKKVIRISVCDWATSEKEIDRSIAAFVAAKRTAESEIAHA